MITTATADQRDLMKLVGPETLAQLHGPLSDADLDLISAWFERHNITAGLDDDTFAERVGIQGCSADSVRIMREIYAEVAR